MRQPNEIYLNGNNSTVQIASGNETASPASVINRDVLNLFYTLKEIEKKFNDELKELQDGNPEEGFDRIADKFYLGYVNMQSAFKSLLAEHVSLEIEKSA